MPIASVVNRQSIEIEHEKIGIVFPVYNQGMPYIIKTFIEKANDLSNKYIFSVCTCGDTPALTNRYLSRIIERKGGVLADGFSVKMPYNYISPVLCMREAFSFFSLREIPLQKQREMFEAWKEKLGDICDYITAGKTGIIETSSEWIERLMDRLNLRDTVQKSAWLKIAGFKGHTELRFMESVKLMDCGFFSDEKCTGCGTCAQVCPVGDIIMEDDRPVWAHKCTQCFACLQWCPNEAIQFGKGTSGRKRYHHPDIKLSDMFKQSVSETTYNKEGEL